MKISNSKFHITKSYANKHIQRLCLITIVVVGLLIRLWMLTLKDHVLRWDADWYYNAGVHVLDGQFPVDCCFHGSGYPIFIALILGATHVIDPQTIRLAQIILDLGTGLLLFASAKKLFGNIPGMITLILYMLNPLTASYTTLLMSEILTLHIISWMVFVVSNSAFHNKWQLWTIFGALLGILFLIKPGFLLFIPIPIVGICILGIRNIRQKFMFALCAILPTLWIVWISGYMHFRVFGVFSPSPPYALSNMTLLYLARHLPVLPETIGEMVPGNKEWDAVLYEYHDLIRKKQYDEITEFNNRYKDRVLNMNISDFEIIAANYVRNLMSFWNKRNLFLHIDLLYPKDTKYVQTGNFLLLFAAIAGFVSGFSQIKKNRNFFVFTVLLFVYGGLFFPLISNLPRHSLPLYPLVFLFGGVGLSKIFALRLLRHS